LVTGGSGFIGTNLVDVLAEKTTAGQADLLNLDLNPPRKRSHAPYWCRCDVLDKDELHKAFSTYKPTHVVHLAARTDTEAGLELDDYRINTEGTANLLDAIKEGVGVERIIVTSSQFVHQYHGVPEGDEDYAPHTAYGKSKVLTEQLTRSADLGCVWTIIRPTNIWGPWHPRYPQEFWMVLKKGRYVHPGKKPVMRMYGYVGNVVAQILGIFELPPERVSGKVLYVGDQAINLLDWVNGFSQKLLGRDVTIGPRPVVRSLALAGDILAFMGISFPITSSRYRSMTTDNEVSMAETFALLGLPPYSLQVGIAETVKWLKSIYSSNQHQTIQKG